MTNASYTPSAPSRWVDLDGPVHYVDHGGPKGGQVLVCVHGLAGSHANWAALAPLLTDRYRVLALDLAGFGLTGGSPRSSSMIGNQQLLNRFLLTIADGPAVLIGNSMGGLITALQASMHPETVRAAVLIDPALPLVPSWPDSMVLSSFYRIGLPRPARRALARWQAPMTTDQMAIRLLRLCCADPGRIPSDVVDQHIALARRRSSVPNIEGDLLLAARSLVWTIARRRRYRDLLSRLQMPVMLLHGDRDRLVSIRAARSTAAANPDWRFEVAKGIGHVPMLEAPEWTAEQVGSWLPTALGIEPPSS